MTYEVVKAHACPDGNKRLALVLLVAFLFINGQSLVLSDDDAVDMLKFVAGSHPDARGAVIQRVADILSGAIVPRRGTDET